MLIDCLDLVRFGGTARAVALIVGGPRAGEGPDAPPVAITNERSP